MRLRPLRILPPLLLALTLAPVVPRLALAQSTSLSWQCVPPSLSAGGSPSGSQCPASNLYPFPVGLASASAHIDSNATTLVKSGAGWLHTLCLNTLGGSSNTATLYDSLSASGTVLAIVDTTQGESCRTYDLPFSSGLTIVTSTGTAGDLTVTFR